MITKAIDTRINRTKVVGVLKRFLASAANLDHTVRRVLCAQELQHSWSSCGLLIRKKLDITSRLEREHFHDVFFQDLAATLNDASERFFSHHYG